MPISQEANVGHLAPDPVRSAASPPAGTTPGHAVAIVFARSTIGDGDGAKATTFFVGERTAFKVERVGVGAEGQQSSAEGENAEGTHDERWVLVEWLGFEDAIWGSCFGGLKRQGKLRLVEFGMIGEDVRLFMMISFSEGISSTERRTEVVSPLIYPSWKIAELCKLLLRSLMEILCLPFDLLRHSP